MKFIFFSQLFYIIKKTFQVALFYFPLMAILSCTPETPLEKKNKKVSTPRITPSPVKILYKRGYFRLDKSTRVLMNLTNEKSKNIGKYLINEIRVKTSYRLKIADIYTTSKIKSRIIINIISQKKIKKEGFKITITSNKISLSASDSVGLYYGTNTLLSLLYKKTSTWKVPQIVIEDHPKTNFRGVYLTIKDSIKNIPDFIKSLKINRINYLIADKRWNISSSPYITIIDTTTLDNDSKKRMIIGSNLKNFYLSKAFSKERNIFVIENKTLLHLDSLSILGEAMWTDLSNRNYESLKSHLVSKN